MPVWPTSRIRAAVVQVIRECKGSNALNVRDGNTVRDFWPGAKELPAALKAQITRRLKERCGLTEFVWPSSKQVRIYDLIHLVEMHQRIGRS